MVATGKFSAAQSNAIELVCQKQQITPDEAIRQAVDETIVKEAARIAAEKSPEEIKRIRAEAFGSWVGPKVDSVEYARALREEWDERERRIFGVEGGQ